MKLHFHDGILACALSEHETLPPVAFPIQLAQEGFSPVPDSLIPFTFACAPGDGGRYLVIVDAQTTGEAHASMMAFVRDRDSADSPLPCD